MFQGVVSEEDFLCMLTAINLESLLNNEVVKCAGNRELFR